MMKGCDCGRSFDEDSDEYAPPLREVVTTGTSEVSPSLTAPTCTPSSLRSNRCCSRIAAAKSASSPSSIHVFVAAALAVLCSEEPLAAAAALGVGGRAVVALALKLPRREEVAEAVPL